MPVDLSEQVAHARQRLAALGIRVGAPPKLPPPINPALAKHAEERAANTQNRIADTITRFDASAHSVCAMPVPNTRALPYSSA